METTSTSNTTMVNGMTFNEWYLYNNRLPMVISAAKRLRIKAVKLANEARANPQDKKLQKAASKAAAMAESRAQIADEVTGIVEKRQNWRDEADRPDYTKQNWYEK